MFQVKGFEFVIMSEELLDKFFLSAFHRFLLPVSSH